MRKPLAVIALSAGVSLAAPAVRADAYRLDSRHSTIGFSVGIAGGLTSVDGRFNQFEGAIDYRPGRPEDSSVRVAFRTESISTGVPGRDEHLRDTDFFDAEKYPEIRFTSDRIRVAERRIEVYGSLTMRGVEKRVRIDMERKHEEAVVMIGRTPTMVLEGGLTVSRGDYGLRATPSWNRVIEATGELAMSDDVAINLRIIAEGERLPADGDAGKAGEPALSSTLLNPIGLVFDGRDALYFAERGGNRVRKLDLATGTVTTVAGTGQRGYGGDGGPGARALLNGPTYLSLSSGGDLIISDTRNQRIRKVDLASGTISTMAGTGKGGYSGDGGPAVDAEIRGPYGVIFDRDGNLVFTDTDNDRIRMVSADTGRISTVAGNGTRGYAGDGGPAIDASFARPHVLAELPDGDLIIGDSFNHRIRRIDCESGHIETIAGDGTEGMSPPGTPGPEARFMYFGEIIADKRGDLLVAEYGNDRIIRLGGPSATIAWVAGDRSSAPRGAAADGYTGLTGLALGRNGDLYVIESGDQSCGRIRRVGTDGEMTTVAGGADCLER